MCNRQQNILTYFQDTWRGKKPKNKRKGKERENSNSKVLVIFSKVRTVLEI